MTGICSRFNSTVSSGLALHGKIPFALLDAGMGTTLEDVFGKDISHPLWSARLVDEDPSTIAATHLAFLEAGSNIILTSTYQIAYETAKKAGYSYVEAESLMRRSVKIAIGTVSPPAPASSSLRRDPLVALSLGPYGATLDSAAEFTGLYPPPYGSTVKVMPNSDDTGRRGPFPLSEEESYIQALASFHFSRLLVYARSRETWDSIDLIAFETVPLVIEAKAIRLAVARLQAWLEETATNESDAKHLMQMKPWYISFVFPRPNGEFVENCPYQQSASGSWRRSLYQSSVKRPYRAYEVAIATFRKAEDSGLERMAIPDGIGINCTEFSMLDSIIRNFAYAIKDLSNSSLDTSFRPWLALYPNRGVAYDTVAKQWQGVNQALEQEDNWAISFTRILENHELEDYFGMFGGLMVGGCCKTKPSDIKALKQALLNSGSLVETA